VSRRSAIFVAASALGAGVFHYLLKWAMARPRPNAAEVLHPGHYSFPSGHSMGTFCLFVAVLLVVRQIDHRKQVPVGIATAMLAVGVGMTRIYLGVHYPTDVLGGWAVGTLWLAILYAWYRRAFLASGDEPVVVTT
jgi:undecaprenyl-diphosphatase